MRRFEPIVAIDVATKEEATELLDKLAVDSQTRPIVKIGMELYYGYGPAIVREAQSRGFAVFLDLKLHDIPNTVQRAMVAVGKLGVAFTTIQAAGGSEMLKAGLAGLKDGAAQAGVKVPNLLAITQLTSIDEDILHNEQHVDLSLIESVQNYARLAKESGLAGVVCSAKEVQAIRQVVGDDFLCITPGIRPNQNVHDDQKRVVTPAQAHELGSNSIVVGRPITRAKDPVVAYQQIRDQFLAGDSAEVPAGLKTTASENVTASRVAVDLLNIKAVTLQPSQPFTWASGLHSPIYTDNRLTISYPAVRRHIFRGMSTLISRYFSDAEVIAGTATAGIPHASWVAEELNLPLIYVRSKPKDHGRGKQLEGVLKQGQKVVVIDDLISTGGSVLKAVNAVRKAGGEVVGVVSVFTYQLPAAVDNFKAAGLTYHSVTNYTKLIETAEAQQLISSDERQSLHAWRQDPQAWSDAH